MVNKVNKYLQGGKLLKEWLKDDRKWWCEPHWLSSHEQDPGKAKGVQPWVWGVEEASSEYVLLTCAGPWHRPQYLSSVGVAKLSSDWSANTDREHKYEYL